MPHGRVPSWARAVLGVLLGRLGAEFRADGPRLGRVPSWGWGAGCRNSVWLASRRGRFAAGWFLGVFFSLRLVAGLGRPARVVFRVASLPLLLVAVPSALWAAAPGSALPLFAAWLRRVGLGCRCFFLSFGVGLGLFLSFGLVPWPLAPPLCGWVAFLVGFLGRSASAPPLRSSVRFLSSGLGSALPPSRVPSAVRVLRASSACALVGARRRAVLAFGCAPLGLFRLGPCPARAPLPFGSPSALYARRFVLVSWRSVSSSPAPSVGASLRGSCAGPAPFALSASLRSRSSRCPRRRRPSRSSPARLLRFARAAWAAALLSRLGSSVPPAAVPFGLGSGVLGAFGAFVRPRPRGLPPPLGSRTLLALGLRFALCLCGFAASGSFACLGFGVCWVGRGVPLSPPPPPAPPPHPLLDGKVVARLRLSSAIILGLGCSCVALIILKKSPQRSATRQLIHR